MSCPPPLSILGLPLGESWVGSRARVAIVGIKADGADFTQVAPETKAHEGDLDGVPGPEGGVAVQ